MTYSANIQKNTFVRHRSFTTFKKGILVTKAEPGDETK